MKAKSKKIVAYCRTASTHLDDHNMIEDQVLAALKYAREKGIEISQFYADNGYSGMNLDRAGIQQLLKDCNVGKIQAIIMRDSDRIARDSILCAKVKFKLKKAGIKLFLTSGESEELNKFQLRVLETIGELA